MIPQTQTQKDITMTTGQIQAVRCAYLDIKGALELIEKGEDLRNHDWNAVELTFGELEEAFNEELKDLKEV
jgi:hypothetical protein